MYYCSYIFTPFSDHSSGKLERNPVWIYCLTESHFNHSAINSLLLGFYPVEKSWSCMQSSFIYRALKKYSQSLEFSNFCHCTKKPQNTSMYFGFLFVWDEQKPMGSTQREQRFLQNLRQRSLALLQLSVRWNAYMWNLKPLHVAMHTQASNATQQNWKMFSFCRSRMALKPIREGFIDWLMSGEYATCCWLQTLSIWRKAFY